MNRISVLILFLVSYSVYGQPSLNFDTTVSRLGIINESAGYVDVVFTFINGGTGELRLNNIVPDPGCTIVSQTYSSVYPGERGEIKIRFNPVCCSGDFRKKILVTADDCPGNIILMIEGTVQEREPGIMEKFPYRIGDVLFSSISAPFHRVSRHNSETMEIRIHNDFRRAGVSISQVSVHDAVSMEFQPEYLKDGETGTMIVTFDPRKLDFTRYSVKKKKDGSSVCFFHDYLLISINNREFPFLVSAVITDIDEK